MEPLSPEPVARRDDPVLPHHDLLVSSEPRPHSRGLALLSVGVLLALVFGVAMNWSGDNSLLPLLAWLGALAGMAVLLVAGRSHVRRHQGERENLAGVEELLQLRRWSEAADLLGRVLSRPMASQQTRVQALVYLAMLLARYHRFADSIEVYDYLLSHVEMEPEGMLALHSGRAMALLRADHLYDADRSIGDLRRLQGDAARAPALLVEIYRDVKTGHPAEALSTFRRHRESLRHQLGHRSADAWALAAAAHHHLAQPAEAQAAWHNATLLAPVVELVRRYPETCDVAAACRAAPPPAEFRPSAVEGKPSPAEGNPLAAEGRQAP